MKQKDLAQLVKALVKWVLLSKKLSFVFLLILWPITGNADYGWLPPYKNLFLSLGGEYFGTDYNFADDGSQQVTKYKSYETKLVEYRFYIDSDYGFAQDWSGKIRINFLGDEALSVKSNEVLLGGGGLGDFFVGVKYRVSKGNPNFTAEAIAKIPTYSPLVDNEVTMLSGDGNADLGFIMHMGYRKNHFIAAVSPQFTLRSGGYAQAFQLKTAVGLKYKPIYAFITTETYLSFGSVLLYDSSFLTHDTAGTGGSYAKASGSPNGFVIGAKTGIELTKTVFLEPVFQMSLFGKRYPKFILAGLNLFIHLDFVLPDNRIKIKPIPLDSEPESEPS